MNKDIDTSLLAPRTCTQQEGSRGSVPLEDFRDTPAYVLLGDPGAGKTASMKQESDACGGCYVTARDFLALGWRDDYTGKTLFIDGLDEVRAGGGDGRTPLDQVRKILADNGSPTFRLSCREADWLGGNDHGALQRVSGDGNVEVLRLDPLGDKDIEWLLENRYKLVDTTGFILEANRRRLDGLLLNPQTLGLLVESIGEAWPDSRMETYKRACEKLVVEHNEEHSAAKRGATPRKEDLLNASGYLCAVQLLAGLAGFALDETSADRQHPCWNELLSPPVDSGLLALALASALFQHGAGAQQRIPVHRSVAEYLGAQHLASRVNEGLPLARILALLGSGGVGVAPDLRGLAAWFAAHCSASRHSLITLDPLAIVLYGDVLSFPAQDKLKLLGALHAEAEKYPWFRSVDWTASPFGALATPDMAEHLLEELMTPSRKNADIAMIDCVLDSLRHGPVLTELTKSDNANEMPKQFERQLENITRDARFPSHIRCKATSILMRELPRNANTLITIAKEIKNGLIEDSDNAILGRLLNKLFPLYIIPNEIFDYLHSRQWNIINSYHDFWCLNLPRNATPESLPELLNKIETQKQRLRKLLDKYQAEKLVGQLLARALDYHGDNVESDLLCSWLGMGLDQYKLKYVDDDSRRHIANWLEARPEICKAIVLEGAARCINSNNIDLCLNFSVNYLYKAHCPKDFGWYLEQAAQQSNNKIAQYLFSQAVTLLSKPGEKYHLTPQGSELLSKWVEGHPQFNDFFTELTSCPIDGWLASDAADRLKRVNEQKCESRFLHDQFDNLPIGEEPHWLLQQLAAIYLKSAPDAEGNPGQISLINHFGEDDELISRIVSSLRSTLERNDLPSVTEIINTYAKGKEHYIGLACMTGMQILYTEKPEEAILLDDNLLEKLFAFRFVSIVDREFTWLPALIKARPRLAARIFVVYALRLLRSKHVQLHALWPHVDEEEFSMFAREALPDLLSCFPLRAKELQLKNILIPLLVASLRYMEKEMLAAIVSSRLAKGSMGMAQRIHWLACALFVAPSQSVTDEYESELVRHINARGTMVAQLVNFYYDGVRYLADALSKLPVSSQALLIELLAPNCPAERPRGAHWVTEAMHIADTVIFLINNLAADPSETAAQQLQRLQTLPALAPWSDRLAYAAHRQLLAQRKALSRPPDMGAVCSTLANLQPANAADLAALVTDHLCDLARRIRDGATNDYSQYWSTSGEKNTPKSENECRDILLSDLGERLGRLNVEASKEGSYAEDKRADIRVSWGGVNGCNIPIEIKKDCHRDLWRAMDEQLIGKYCRDPGCEGYGVYLVFWFGGDEMPLPPSDRKPKNAREMEERLQKMIPEGQTARISVCVIDCAQPRK